MKKYMFENKSIDPMTWLNLQTNTGLACRRVMDVEKAGPVWEITDSKGDFCFVYSDEAEQFSNPYPTKEEAAERSRAYADWLSS